MTADARQRIVTELVDFPDGITISVSVSPVFTTHICAQCVAYTGQPDCCAACSSQTGLVHMLLCCLHTCVVSDSSLWLATYVVGIDMPLHVLGRSSSTLAE